LPCFEYRKPKVKADPIIEDFARRFPAAFTLHLANGTPQEALSILEALPASLAVRIAAALPPSRFGAIAELDSARLVGWLEQADLDTGVAFVGRLPRQQGLQLIDALKNQKLKRRLGRALRYPSHCVGAWVAGDVIQVSMDSVAADVRKELRRIDGQDGARAVVLDARGRYAGMLDVWRLLIAERAEGRVREFIQPVLPLRPETPITDARTTEQWSDHLWLPVVDIDGRVLGYITKKALELEMEAEPEPLLEEAFTLGEDFVRVSSSLLDTLLRGWTRQ
jgi:Mg/Co/Ni transporter MgtE